MLDEMLRKAGIDLFTRRNLEDCAMRSTRFSRRFQAVECAVKRDQMRALCVPAREFDCRLDGLRAGVAQKRARVAATREQSREPLRNAAAHESGILALDRKFMSQSMTRLYPIVAFVEAGFSEITFAKCSIPPL